MRVDELPHIILNIFYIFLEWGTVQQRWSKWSRCSKWSRYSRARNFVGVGLKFTQTTYIYIYYVIHVTFIMLRLQSEVLRLDVLFTYLSNMCRSNGVCFGG